MKSQSFASSLIASLFLSTALVACSTADTRPAAPVKMADGVLTEQSAYALISRAGHSLSPAAEVIREEILAEERIFGQQVADTSN